MRKRTHKQKKMTFVEAYKRDYRQFRLHHKIFFTITGLVGVVLVWRGVWTFFDWAHLLEHPIASTAVGMALVGVSGAFFNLL